MRRKLFSILSTVSLLLCVATCVLWARSYTHYDSFDLPNVLGQLRAGSNWGELIVNDGPRYDVESERLGAHYDRFSKALNELEDEWKSRAWRQGEEDGFDRARAAAIQRLWDSHVAAKPSVGPLTTYVAVHHAWAAAAFAGLPAWWLVYNAWAYHRRLKRAAQGLCPACGYDLRATPGRCPECGAVPAVKGRAA